MDRRDFLTVAGATAFLLGASGRLSSLAAAQKIAQEDLLAFDPLGQVTLVHLTDIHAQLRPVYFREPTVNLGVGAAKGLPPHITGAAYLERFGLNKSSLESYMLTDQDFVAMAREYGRVGGMDRIATIVKSIKSNRPDNTIVLDGGDTWQGSYTSLKTLGGDMVRVMNAIGVEAMTGHWEFTLGQDRVQELVDELPFPFLGGNVRDTEWDEPVFESTTFFERGGVKVAVIGQAFPYTPVANPRYMIPDWAFGIREDAVRGHVEAAREDGAQLVVLLSHNGFDVDRKMAANIDGIDVILTGHTHDALPTAEKVGNTLLIGTGSHGKFVSRLDLDVGAGGVKDFRYRLIPVLADAITPDPEVAAIIAEERAPYETELARVVGTTDSLLYRRGNFNGTMDDLICQALLAERDAEIAMSPGFRWGASLLPGQDITMEDVYNATAMTYPAAYRTEMTGAFVKEILEDVADNLFNPDPYYQQGGDMVRVGGLGYRIEINKPIGQRITNMTSLKDGQQIDPERNYVVAGWASVNEGTEGPAIWDVVENYISDKGTVTVDGASAIDVVS